MADPIFSNYRIHYSFGQHDLNLDVPSYEFERVVDELSKEFEIYKEFESWDSYDFEGCECLETSYFITDYCGNPFKIGDVFERKLKS